MQTSLQFHNHNILYGGENSEFNNGRYKSTEIKYTSGIVKIFKESRSQV